MAEDGPLTGQGDLANNWNTYEIHIKSQWVSILDFQDMMLPIEIVSPRDPFLLRARESYNIWKFQTEKRMGICDIEHGLNLDAGQQWTQATDM